MTRRRRIIFLAITLIAVAAIISIRKRSFVHQPLAVVSAVPNESSPVPVAVPERSWPTPFSVDLKGLPPKEDLRPGTLRILVLGDSVAKFLGLAMRYRQEERKTFVGDRGVGDCSLFEEKPYLENGQQKMTSSCSMNWVKDTAELRPDVTFIVLGGGFFSPDACKKQFRIDYEKRFFDLTSAMGNNAGQIVVARVPYPVKHWRHSNVMERVDCFNEVLVGIAQKGHWKMVDLMSHVCPTRECTMESEGKPIRPDGLHFDGGGTEETARWVLDELWRVREKPIAN